VLEQHKGKRIAGLRIAIGAPFEVSRFAGPPILSEASLQGGDVIEIGPARLLYRPSAGERTT